MKLLDNIEKRPYQGYTIEHGIERIHIKVPLSNAREFETAIAEAIADGTPSRAVLLDIVAAHDGTQRQTKRGV